VGAKGKRWVARINYGGKKHTIGTFDTKEEAALAYDRSARQCGEDKQLNYGEAQVEHAPTQPEEAPKKRKDLRPPDGDGGGKRQHKGV
jgi:hypothetical protein